MSREISKGAHRLSISLGALSFYAFEVGFLVFLANVADIHRGGVVIVGMISAVGGVAAFMLLWGLVRAVAWVAAGYRKD